MTIRPTAFPDYDLNQVNSSAPSNSVINNGHALDDILTSGEINYDFGLLGLWTRYFDAANAAFFFGDGSDGSATITSATQTVGTWLSSGVMQRDAYLSALTINSAGAIITNGYKLFVSGTLDLSAAAAGAIQWQGNFASSGSLAGGAGLTAATLGGSAGGGANSSGGGVAGGTAAVSNCGGGGGGGSLGTTTSPGGQGGGVNNLTTGATGGAGGVGTGGSPVNGSAGGSATSPCLLRRPTLDLMRGTTLLVGGAGGGGTAGNTAGGGGGGGGMGLICAQTINRSGSSAAGSINFNGGGGFNTNLTGPGAGGGAGGEVHLVYQSLAGSSATSIVTCNGSNGETSVENNGGGGGGGAGGLIVSICLGVSVTVVVGTAGSAGGAGTGGVKGTGGAGGTCTLTL